MRTDFSHAIGLAPSVIHYDIRHPMTTYWCRSGAEIESRTGQGHVSLIFRDTYQRTMSAMCTIVHSDAVLFDLLLHRWYQERGVTSSLSEMTMCPSYLKIIAMGSTALPLILNQLKREGDDPDHWFAALEAITGHDPISEDIYGDTVKMAAAWFNWADENNAW